MSEVEHQLVVVQSALAADREELHRREEKILVANERQAALERNIERYGKEKIDLRAQQENLEKIFPVCV